jgi:hypothetical protein
MEVTRWQSTTLQIEKGEELFELLTNSRGGFVFQAFSNEVELDFLEYADVTNISAHEGDLPFFIGLDEFAFNVFAQPFELIGKISLNLDQPGNIFFALYVSNPLHRDSVAGILFNGDTNDVIYSSDLHCGSIAITPIKRGYSVLIFDLYSDRILGTQPVDRCADGCVHGRCLLQLCVCDPRFSGELCTEKSVDSAIFSIFKGIVVLLPIIFVAALSIVGFFMFMAPRPFQADD